MGVELVVVRLRGRWNVDEVCWNVVWGEIDDVDVVVQKVDESVIVEPWIVVCALAMLEHVGGEEEKWLGQVGCDGQERQVRWVVLWVQVGAWP